MPISRGKRSDVGPILVKTWNAAPCRTRPWGSSPSNANDTLSHRVGSESFGGSETINTPPTLKNLAAHSAVTAGGPKDRAVTKSNASESPLSRAICSARPVINTAFFGASGLDKTSPRNLIRFSIESMRTPRQPQRSSRTRPGRPPPLPRSKNSRGGEGRISSQH
jgi:hypothetical protein